MNTSMQSMFVQMGFEIFVLLLVVASVYLKLIPNDLLILALGIVIRGALSYVPTVTAITQNTAATKENTLVMTQTPQASVPEKSV